MSEPRKDTRAYGDRKDRAAYMRDYRARRRKEIPTIEALTQRVAILEADLAAATDWIAMQRNLDADIAQRSIRAPRPAPKPSGKR